MSLKKTVFISYLNLKSVFFVFLYKKFGLNIGYPIQVNAQLTTICNSRCNMCDVWRERGNDLPAAYWINAIDQYRRIAGIYKINFAGGEVILKKDFFEIAEFCHKKNILWGITTNGHLLTPENVQKLLSFNPYNINISLDSLNPRTYEQIRGVDFLEKVKSNMEYLMQYKVSSGSDVKIGIKTVVNSLNLKELEDLARYATELDVTGITFDPIRRRRKIFVNSKIPEFELLADINLGLLQHTKERLVLLKKQGLKILNSERNIRQWFKEEYFSDNYFCSAPLKYLMIESGGSIKLCDFTDFCVGNIKNDSLKEIISSESCRNQMRMLVKCPNPRVYCINRHFMDYFKLFFKYIRK